jgi:hypothetical protein
MRDMAILLVSKGADLNVPAPQYSAVSSSLCYGFCCMDLCVSQGNTTALDRATQHGKEFADQLMVS